MSKAAAATVVHAADPVAVFDSAPLGIRRAVFDELLSVDILKRSEDSAGRFDPVTVWVIWKTAR